jgi:hypothetical protein
MVTISVEQRAIGVYLLNWSTPGDLLPPGDALLVDAQRAEVTWFALADILVHPCPVPEQLVAAVSQRLLSHNSSAVWLIRMGRNRWVAGGPGGQTGVVTVPDMMSLLTGAVLVYSWERCGWSLPTAPPVAPGVPSLAEHPDAPA